MNTRLGEKALAATGLSYHSIEDALLLSQKSGKPVIANFSAIWCSACRQLNENIFSNEEVKAFINENFHFARLEYEASADKKWFAHYQVISFPTLKLIYPNAEEGVTLQNPKSAKQFIASLLKNHHTIN